MEKRAEMFEKNLSAYDLITLSYICKRDVQDNVDEIVDNKMFAINQAIYSATSAAIYELTDLSIEQTKQIIESTNNYIKESEDFLIKYKEDWVMEINKNKDAIKEECIKILDKNINGQNEALKELKVKFKNIPPKDLANIFKEAKEEWMKPKAEREKTATQNKPISEQKELSNAITPKKENKANTELIDKQNKEIKGMFTEVEKITILKTANGTYKRTEKGVEFFERLYKEPEEALEENKIVLDKFEKQKLENIMKMNELQNEISRIEEQEEKAKIITEEIIAAFEYVC